MGYNLKQYKIKMRTRKENRNRTKYLEANTERLNGANQETSQKKVISVSTTIQYSL